MYIQLHIVHILIKEARSFSKHHICYTCIYMYSVHVHVYVHVQMYLYIVDCTCMFLLYTCTCICMYIVHCTCTCMCSSAVTNGRTTPTHAHTDREVVRLTLRMTMDRLLCTWPWLEATQGVWRNSSAMEPV